MLSINNTGFYKIDHTTDAGIPVQIDFTQAETDNVIKVRDPLGESRITFRDKRHLERSLNQLLDSLAIDEKTGEYCPPF